jgi:hypothetical protein
VKILLDEHVAHRLRHEIVGHEVVTVQYAKLQGFKNGVLLTRAAQLDFDALITTDRGMQYEQNVAADLAGDPASEDERDPFASPAAAGAS